MKKTIVSIILMIAVLLSCAYSLAEPDFATVAFDKWQMGSEDGRLFIYRIVSGYNVRSNGDVFAAYAYVVVDENGVRLAVSPNEEKIRAGYFITNDSDAYELFEMTIETGVGISEQTTGICEPGSCFIGFSDMNKTMFGTLSDLIILNLRASDGVHITMTFSEDLALHFDLPGMFSSFDKLHDLAEDANWKGEI